MQTRKDEHASFLLYAITRFFLLCFFVFNFCPLLSLRMSMQSARIKSRDIAAMKPNMLLLNFTASVLVSHFVSENTTSEKAKNV